MATRKPSRPASARRKPSRSARASRKPARAPRPSRTPARKARPAAASVARKVERPRRSPETLRLRSFTPGFTVDDLQRSLDYYTNVLGFIVDERWTDDGGKLHGVMLKAGSCLLGLSQYDWAKGRDRQKGAGLRIWCQTNQDIDALAARIKSTGGQLLHEPMDEPWGDRTLSVDDPDGFRLTFARKSR